MVQSSTHFGILLRRVEVFLLSLYLPVLGETAAAMRVLQKHWNKFRGIAICGGNYQDGQPFIVHDMLKLLNLDPQKPPDGCIALSNASRALQRTNDNRS